MCLRYVIATSKIGESLEQTYFPATRGGQRAIQCWSSEHWAALGGFCPVSSRIPTCAWSNFPCSSTGGKGLNPQPPATCPILFPRFQKCCPLGRFYQPKMWEIAALVQTKTAASPETGPAQNKPLIDHVISNDFPTLLIVWTEKLHLVHHVAHALPSRCARFTHLPFQLGPAVFAGNFGLSRLPRWGVGRPPLNTHLRRRHRRMTVWHGSR